MATQIIRDLGEGLVLRRGRPEDAEALDMFNATMHGNRRENLPDERVGAWARDLAERPHPTFRPDLYTIVEDTASGEIASSLCDIPQTWTYEGIPFGVGRPELVGTLAEYRDRGLVRAQFDAIHGWSDVRGDLIQVITGIPYFYRQFGYEMTVNLGGGRSGAQDEVPALKEGEQEPFCIRPATSTDLATIAAIYGRASARHLLSCVRDEATWRYELGGRSAKNVHRQVLSVIQRPSGQAVGYLAHNPGTHEKALGLTAYELVDGVSWSAVTPTVLRYLKATGELYAAEEKKPFVTIGFWLGAEHASYPLVQGRLSRISKPYAWYIRVANLPALLQRIAPALDARLARSALTGHTGECKISFYRSGVRLAFEEGRLTTVEHWRPTADDRGAAAFPDRTFLQLLFGYRTLEELTHAFPDCRAGDDTARTLLEVLFPKRASNLWPLA